MSGPGLFRQGGQSGFSAATRGCTPIQGSECPFELPRAYGLLQWLGRSLRSPVEVSGGVPPGMQIWYDLTVMPKIAKHPVLDIAPMEQVVFLFEGREVVGEKGLTIAAALHEAGFPVHSHSIKNRNRSLECGIGKCGACEMLVDGQIRRICVTPVDDVKEVAEIPNGYAPTARLDPQDTAVNVYRTEVAIVGAGPAALAAREVLMSHGVPSIIIDSQSRVGGQFLMQTHRFFFFEKNLRFGGMRGYEIAESLAGEDRAGIFLDATVWDILQGKRLAVKNTKTQEIFYIDAQYLIIAAGAIPFVPAFRNDDVPGVYSAAVIQKMMNTEYCLLGRRVLTVGAGNIGYLTSYQLMQAGAQVKAIVEVAPKEGGFPVQANRIKRLGVPVLCGRTVVEAIPNNSFTGIVGAVIADCEDSQPVPGTEKRLYGINTINVCTGLVPDDLLLRKGNEVFGRACFGAGDAIRIGEGTSAVLRGKQVAYEVLEAMSISYSYDDFLTVSKNYIDSQQHPIRLLDEPQQPPPGRKDKPFVLIDCLHGFACNPCAFACPHNVITKSSTSTVPRVDFDRCVGCMQCVTLCPGLAIFGYDLPKKQLFLPAEFFVSEGSEVLLVDNDGKKLGQGLVIKAITRSNKTTLVTVEASDVDGDDLLAVRGFISKDRYPEPLEFQPHDRAIESETYVCHCDDVKLSEVLEAIGDRKFVSVDEIKHTTRLGMGACRGKRCIKRLKQTIGAYGISIVGEPTPRAPLSNQLLLGELYPRSSRTPIVTDLAGQRRKRIRIKALIAGGGIGGSALFRYMAEAGLSPVLVNTGHGASWRNIGGGRPNFSLPELSEIARQNLAIFRQLHKVRDIGFRSIQYVTFAHDQMMAEALARSMDLSDATMIEPKDFTRYVTPHINPNVDRYVAALVNWNCWQATPGKVVDAIRRIGIEQGGVVREDCRLIDVRRDGDTIKALVRDHDKRYIEFEADHFVNALGPEAEPIARRLGLDTGLYNVKHQAFITRRLPPLGVNNTPLPMMIDRRTYRGFSAVYGQQLGPTGQIIGCASPAVDSVQANKNLKINTQDFLEIVAETFVNWIPCLSSVEFQATWAGYYVEPRMAIDPERGLFVGLRGQGFMLAQYLAKLYVDRLLGRSVPTYFDRLSLEADGLCEKAFR